MTKVALIESHPLMRLGLHQILTTLPGQWDVRIVDPGKLAQEAGSQVEILLFGLKQPPDPGWTILEQAQALLEPEKILLLTEAATAWSPPPQWIEGVYGCIAKTSPVAVLEAALHLGLAGGQCFPAGDQTAGVLEKSEPAPIRDARVGAPPASATPVDWRHTKAVAPGSGLQPQRTINDATTGAQILNLTPRQYEVLKLLARGYPIKTVSRTLNISTATAKAHASTLYQRLRVNSKGEAVYAARQRGVTLD